MGATDEGIRSSPTPILDCLEPLPPRAQAASRSATLARFLFGACVGASVSTALWYSPSFREGLFARFDAWFSGPWTAPKVVAVVVSLLVVVPAAIAIHELGHALGGILAGFRFDSLRVGPLQVDRSFRVSRYRGSGSGYGGWAIVYPVRLDRLRERASLMVFAGPGVNLASAGVLLLLPFEKGLVATTFIAVSLLLGVRELVPLRTRTAVSDGGRLWMLWRDRGAGERWAALLKLSAELTSGVMSELLSRDGIAKATAVVDASPDTVTAHGIAYSAAFHRRDDDEAARMLETCLRYSGHAAPAMLQALISDACVFQARRRKRVDLARRWFERVSEAAEFAWLRLRAEAAMREADGDLAGALAKLAGCEKAIRAEPPSSAQDVKLRFLQRWMDELRATTPVSNGGSIEPSHANAPAPSAVHTR